jgi:hypothetical protein
MCLPAVLTARHLCPHHILIDRAEAVFIFFVAAHEIEFGAIVFTSPLCALLGAFDLKTLCY